MFRGPGESGGAGGTRGGLNPGLPGGRDKIESFSVFNSACLFAAKAKATPASTS